MWKKPITFPALSQLVGHPLRIAKFWLQRLVRSVAVRTQENGLLFVTVHSICLCFGCLCLFPCLALACSAVSDYKDLQLYTSIIHLFLLGHYIMLRKIFEILSFCIPVQSNLNSSNTDGSFTLANSNSFLSPYEILLLAQENKYLGKFSYFIMKLYVVCTH